VILGFFTGLLVGVLVTYVWADRVMNDVMLERDRWRNLGEEQEFKIDMYKAEVESLRKQIEKSK
jgi:transcription initiation factor IIF auxiliary subunit